MGDDDGRTDAGAEGTLQLDAVTDLDAMLHSGVDLSDDPESESFGPPPLPSTAPAADGGLSRGKTLGLIGAVVLVMAALGIGAGLAVRSSMAPDGPPTVPAAAPVANEPEREPSEQDAPDATGEPEDEGPANVVHIEEVHIR